MIATSGTDLVLGWEDGAPGRFQRLGHPLVVGCNAVERNQYSESRTTVAKAVQSLVLKDTNSSKFSCSAFRGAILDPDIGRWRDYGYTARRKRIF